MDLVSAGQTRRRQGLLSLYSLGLWGLALVLLSLLFLEDGEPRRNMACVFSFFFHFTQINIGLEMG